MREYDVLVIGGGPAGMAAALGALDVPDTRVLLVERMPQLGGILNQCLHRGFGLTFFGEELTGPEYAARFVKNIAESHVEVLTDTTVIDLNSNGIALICGSRCGLLEVRAKAIILAAGCRERPIGSLPITGTRPSGIFTAGAAQRMVNLSRYDIGNRIIILGSGDVGLIIARHLIQQGKTILAVLEKEDHCGGLERNRIGCLDAFGIPLLTQTTITRIHGSARIEAVTVLNLLTGQEYDIACDTLITSVGLIPEQELAEQAACDRNLPDWLFLSGNACFVHDLVDDVTTEALYTGRQAALFSKSGKRKHEDKRSSATAEPFSDSHMICIGCPKSCRLIETSTGYQGAVCGRRNPVIAIQRPD